jgi:hypothetical protein
MNTLLRWGKFNLVGAMGMGLQLAALALFNRWTAGHYLYASAAAIELTLLHNFMWHSHYTWRDRRDNDIRLRQFARFHLSNGLVSMLGNLTLKNRDRLRRFFAKFGQTIPKCHHCRMSCGLPKKSWPNKQWAEEALARSGDVTGFNLYECPKQPGYWHLGRKRKRR